MGQPNSYNQYKSYIKQIWKVTKLDGKNINDTSYMNQHQQTERDLFWTTNNATKVNFFDSAPTNINILNNDNTNQAMNNNST